MKFFASVFTKQHAGEKPTADVHFPKGKGKEIQQKIITTPTTYLDIKQFKQDTSAKILTKPIADF